MRSQPWCLSHSGSSIEIFRWRPQIPNYITKIRLFKYIENFTSKFENFQIKKLWFFFRISAQNLDCGYSLEPPRRGDSVEYPQSMFLSRNKKNNVYTCKPQFYYIKVGFNRIKIIQACFCDGRYLKEDVVLASLMLSGRSFFALMLEGRKELKKRFVFACIDRISFAFLRQLVVRSCTRGGHQRL